MKLTKTYMMTTLLCSLCLFSGCSTSVNEAETNEINSTTDALHISREVSDKEGYVIANIDAEVVYPTTNDIPVATIIEHQFDSNDIAQFANGIYGNSEYHKLLDDSEYSLDQIADAIESTNLLVNDLDELYNHESIDYNRYIDELYSCNSRIGKLNYYATSASSEVNDTPVLDFYEVRFPFFDMNDSYFYNPDTDNLVVTNEGTETKCQLVGTYNNSTCTLLFNNENKFKLNVDPADTPVWKDYTYNQIEFGLIEDRHFLSFNNNTKNECSYSTEQSINLCDGMLKSLGINNMSPMDMSHLSVKAFDVSPTGYQYGTLIDTGYCGYQIYYGKTVNSIDTNLTSTIATGDYSTIYDKGAGNVYGSEYIIFTVMDSGIISMVYNCPTEITNITSSDTAILDFDSILTFADSYLLELYSEGNLGNRSLNVSRVQFGLARTANTIYDDQFTLIPVWTFYDGNSFIPVLVINAIDGTQMNVFSGVSMN